MYLKDFECMTIDDVKEKVYSLSVSSLRELSLHLLDLYKTDQQLIFNIRQSLRDANNCTEESIEAMKLALGKIQELKRAAKCAFEFLDGSGRRPDIAKLLKDAIDDEVGSLN